MVAMGWSATIMIFDFEIGSFSSYSTFAKLGTLAVVTLAVVIIRRRDPLEDIPKVKSSNLISSYINGFIFMSRAKEFILEGYEKYSQKEGIFRIPTPIGWLIIVAGKKYIDELRTKRGEELSAPEAMRQVTSGNYTFGAEIFDKPYHLPLVRTKLTRYIGAFFDNTRQEVIMTCNELLPSDSNWKTVKIYSVCQLIGGRAANRSYVNDPSIYRDPGYLRVMVNFAKTASQGGITLRFFPDILKPIVAPLLTNVPASVDTAIHYLSRTIKDRVQKYKSYGPDYPDREEDMLSWFIDLVDEEDRNIRHLTQCLLHLNTAAIVTTSTSLYVTLYSLASHPEYIEPIREEIRSIVAVHGWSKISMGRMQKLDSFIMETMRFYPPAVLTSPRLATVDYVFSTGVRVPKNSLLAVVTLSRQMDDHIYPNAKTFDGFRFYNLDNRSKESSEESDKPSNSTWIGTSSSSKLTTLSTDFLLFGIGEHACPGRFFAANLLKIALSHILITYDFKIDPARPPTGKYVTVDYFPNPEDVLLFRKRETP